MDFKLERVNCPLCLSSRAESCFEKDGFRIVRCSQCSLVYVNPRLSSRALEALYNANEISPQQYYEENISHDLKHFGKRLSIIEQYAKGGELLDIGTNIGTMLKIAKDRGWHVRGVEFNKKAAAFGKERFDVEIDDRDIMEIQSDPDRFDVVVMNDVIEHVIDPKALLLTIHRMMKRDGILFLTTPNIAGWLARLSGRRWLHLKPNEHLTYFTPRTMENLLEKTGFRMLECRSIGRIRNLETIFQKSRAYSIGPYKLSRFIPRSIRENFAFHINPGDEMAVVARKV